MGKNSSFAARCASCALRMPCCGAPSKRGLAEEDDRPKTPEFRLRRSAWSRQEQATDETLAHTGDVLIEVRKQSEQIERILLELQKTKQMSQELRGENHDLFNKQEEMTNKLLDRLEALAIKTTEVGEKGNQKKKEAAAAAAALLEGGGSGRTQDKKTGCKEKPRTEDGERNGTK